MSGLIADAKTLIDKARVETQVSESFFIIRNVTKANESHSVIIVYRWQKKFSFQMQKIIL